MINIINAWYGNPMDDTQGYDVTDIIKNKVSKGELSIDVSNKNFGDPCVGVLKKLKIKYKIKDTCIKEDNVNKENEYDFIIDENKEFFFYFLEEIKKKGNWLKLDTFKKKKMLSTVGTKGPTGIHNYCCWCIGCRLVNWGKQCNKTCYGNPNKLPKIIFIHNDCFKFFYRNIFTLLPNNYKYKLILGDHDTTIPMQIDVRYDKNSVFQEKEDWNSLILCENIKHIFITHLDIPMFDKFSPIPVGFNPDEFESDIFDLNQTNINLNIDEKPIIIFNCNRIHDTSIQWNDRLKCRKLCNNEWKKFTVNKPNLDKHIFIEEIQKYPFALCPHGGGLEPNPKVFTCIFYGVIPIVKHFINCEYLYDGLPVVIIPEWEHIYINTDLLIKWIDKFKDYFYDKKKRLDVLNKLTNDYWFNIINTK